MWAKEKGACGMDFHYVVFEQHANLVMPLWNWRQSPVLYTYLPSEGKLLYYSDDCDEHGSARVVPCIVAQVSNPTFEKNTEWEEVTGEHETEKDNGMLESSCTGSSEPIVHPFCKLCTH